MSSADEIEASHRTRATSLPSPRAPLWAALFAFAAVTLILVIDLPTCPLRTMLGMPCPGCGMTRAARALVALEPARAAAHHPLVFLVGPLVGTALVTLVLRATNVLPPTANDPLSRLPRWTWWLLVALVLGVWVARFLGAFGGPSDPVDFRGSFLGRLVHVLAPP